MALGGPNIYPMIAGCSYPDCLPRATVAKVKTESYAQAQSDLRDLLDKTRHQSLSGRLSAVIAWAGDDLDQMAGLAFPKVRGCAYSLDECPYDWCATHDDKYYCTPACVVGHERQDERCG